MTKQPMTIDKQALREAAEKALPAMQRLLMMPNDELFDEALLNVDGDVDAANAFNLLTGPETVLALLLEWPHGKFFGVPVWHMNEPDERFVRLCNEYPRVAIGSCGEYDVKRPKEAIARLRDLIRHVVNDLGQPVAKLHGLRMLRPQIFTSIQLASADSTNVARNIGIDKAWKGSYAPASKETRAALMVERIESHNSPGSLNYCAEKDKFNMQLQLAV